ncbi:uncharacterized protein A4U43_C02F3480 [Asparagus officinalis]|uniref:Late embryogenesis abundant protein LEA-2 subgroup domain-containing protein n=1 Tax=Asparagus officinalis TaxID=4686 RepID=A0A5P1FI98_ASPOF|nr:uncharacterized protein LOC109830038 [Asparagus officinalis]ONK77137.1 uncharacterized protein A4U43_C02F3480 [Asparagus officinalis]
METLMASYSNLHAKSSHPYEFPYEKEGHSYICRLFTALVFIFILVAILDKTANIVLRPNYPSVFVISATVSSFKLYQTPRTYSSRFEYVGHLASAFNITFSVQNPNSHMAISYDDIYTSVKYSYGLVQGCASLPAFKQENRDRTSVLLSREDDHELMPGSFDKIAKGLKENDGMLEFKVRFEAKIRFSRLMWFPRKMEASCYGVKIRFPNDTEMTGLGGIMVPPTSCDVQLSRL